MNAASQWTTIGWMVACGLAMGTGFDVYRVASHRFRIPRWLLPALDLAFWLAATLGVFSVLLDNNDGEVRMYVFLGLGIGVTGYFGLFSHRVVRAAAWLMDAFTGTLSWLANLFRLLLLVPLLWLVRVLAKLLDIVFVVIAALLLWIFRLLLIPLRPLSKRVWLWLLPVRRRVRAWMDAASKLRKKIRAAWEVFRKKT